MSITVTKVLDLARSQIGYKEGKNNENKYAAFFDAKTGAWQYFNTKKQNSPWCSVGLHWCVYQISNSDACRKFWNEPKPADNCGAGVKFVVQYMKKQIVKVKDAKAGDLITFNGDSHIGIIESVDEKIHTIEFNKSDSVKRCTYTLTSNKISHIIRPKYDAEEASKPEAPKADHKIDPAASFSSQLNRSFIVNTKTDPLNMRTGFNKDSKIICKIPKGAEVRCYGFYTGEWLVVTYKGFTGYVNKNYLRKV